MKLNIQLFATSASVTSNTYEGRYLKLTVKEETLTAQDKLDNVSRVTWKFESTGGSSSYYTIYNWSVKVNGSQIYEKTTTTWSEQTFPAKTGSRTGTIRVAHKADGTANNVSFTMQGRVYSSGTDTYNGSINLTTIPRASDVTSVTDGTANYYPVVKWTPNSDEFKFKVGFSKGSWSYLSDLISPASTSEQTFNSYQLLASNLAPYFNTNITEEVTCTIYTYASDGTTQIGDPKSKTFNVTLPNTYYPDLSHTGPTEADATMIAKNWGVFVKGKSKLRILTTATAKTGATIVEQGVTVEGKFYSGSDITTDYLTQYGTNRQFMPYCKDSRDVIIEYTGNDTKYVVYDYDEPYIATAIANRCQIDGTLDEAGTCLKYSFNGIYSSCNNHNVVVCKLWYKLKTDSTYTNYKVINANSTDVVISDVVFSASFPYDIKFEITDSFNATAIETTELRTGFKLVHYNKNKSAIALGKTSEATTNQKLLEVALPLELVDEGKSSILDLIYPVGSIYMSTNNVSPQTFFGGTWQPIEDTFLLSAGSTYAAGATGGEAEHTLIEDEIPAHTHGSKSLSGTFRLRKSTGNANEITNTSGIVSSAAYSTTTTTITNSSTAYGQQTITINATHEHNSVGEGLAHNNMPPYLVVYMWERTA